MGQAKLPREASVGNLLQESQPLKYLYTEFFTNDHLEWNEIYKLPFKVAVDTRSREFQYKILNRYLATNSLLKKMGKIDSSSCSFCST